MPKPQFTFVDLFAGIGGMRLAFEAVGGKCVSSSEWDSFACETYKANFGEEPRGDITQIEPFDIPQHDILVAGFPCQPFSIAGVTKNNALGKEHGFRHATQGTLFFGIKRIIEETRPRAFLLENVKNLVNHDEGRTFKVILRTLEKELKYTVKWDVIDASEVLPQHRERVYIVGFRQPVDFEFPTSFANQIALKDVLQSNVSKRYQLTPHLWEYLQSYAAKHRSKGNGFGYGLVTDRKFGITRTLSARYYKDGSEILVPTKTGPPRRLTPRECARLMGFPDSFKIEVSDTQAYKQFGNSVAVPIVKGIAEAMRDVLVKRRSPDGYVRGRMRTTLIHSASNGLSHNGTKKAISATSVDVVGRKRAAVSLARVD